LEKGAMSMGYYYPNYQSQYSNQYQSQFPNQQPQMQIQNGGFLPVRSRQEAMNYPVAPGMSVTFKDESAPYIYTKTKGFNQFDEPVFDVYKLTKEEMPSVNVQEAHTDVFTNKTENVPQYALKSDFDALQKLVDILQNEMHNLKKESERDEPITSVSAV
jgi:hypothetical protein